MTPNIKGAVLMVASMVCFTVNDTFIKLTDNALPLAQLLTIRGVLAIACLAMIAAVVGALDWKAAIRARSLILLRAIAETGAAFFFLSALMNLPLANVTAILQALPLVVALAAYLFLREPLGWRRLAAIGIGFLGMLLIVRPGADTFSIWSLYAMAAVFCVTARDLIARQLPKDVPSLTVALSTTVFVTLAFAALSTRDVWLPVDGQLWGMIIGSTVFIVGGYFFSVQVMRVGEISFVAPFRYSGLVAAMILGVLVFDHWPDSHTLSGAAIIVSTGLFTLYRERRASRRESRPDL